MAHVLLVTGPPGCGKTTLVRRVVECLPCPASGFYTEEVREAGRRVGFRLVTLDGQTGILAHVNWKGKTPFRVGRYGVEVGVLDTLGVDAIRRAVEQGILVVIDEIGPMELFSAAFRDAVLWALDQGACILGTVVRRPVPFAEALKRRPDVTVVEVSPENRDRLVDELVARIRKWPCCRQADKRQ